MTYVCCRAFMIWPKSERRQTALRKAVNGRAKCHVSCRKTWPFAMRWLSMCYQSRAIYK